MDFSLTENPGENGVNSALEREERGGEIGLAGDPMRIEVAKKK